MPSILIQLPTEVSYFGSTATSEDVTRILDNMEAMIRSEFGDRMELEFERIQTPRGTGVHSSADDWIARDEVFQWTQDNWEAAL